MSAPTHSILLTPPGAGAIAVIRIVGPDAVRIVDQAFQPKGPRRLGQSSEGQLRYGHIIDDGEPIDDAIVCRIASGTGDTVEICCHGGVRVVERVLSLLERLGAAFGTDLKAGATVWHARSFIEAEAIEAMPAAKTERALRFLAFQRANLAPHLEHLAEACLSSPASALAEFDRLLKGVAAAQALLGGWTMAIVGPPNSGKSTLFNQLVGRARAVVSPQAGTTRDWIEEQIEIEGMPIRLIDTAGRHGTGDPLETEAIEAGGGVISRADALILVLDQSSPLPPRLDRPALDIPCIVAANKSDLPWAWQFSDLGLQNEQRVRISAAIGSGVADLCHLVPALAGLRELQEDRPAMFTDRQRRVLDDARAALDRGGCAVARDILKQQLLLSDK